MHERQETSWREHSSKSKHWFMSSGPEQRLAPPFLLESGLLLYLSLRWAYCLIASKAFFSEGLAQSLITAYVLVYVLLSCRLSQEHRIPRGVDPRSCKDSDGAACAALLGTMCAASLLYKAVGNEAIEQWRDVYWITACAGFWVVTASLVPPQMSLFSSQFRALGCTVSIFVLATVLKWEFLTIETFMAIVLYTFVIKWLLVRWKKCFTVCEASLMSLAACLLINRAVQQVVSKAIIKGGIGQLPGDAVTCAALLMTVLLGAVAVPTALKLRYSRVISNGTKWAAISGSLLVSALVIYGWCWFLMGGRQEPVVWLLKHVFTSKKRIGLCLFWLLMLSVPLFLVPPHTLGVSSIIARKSYHALAMLMFLPAILIDVEFLRMGLAVSLVAMMVVETLRISTVKPLSEIIETTTVPLLDSRDEGVVVMTHMYLLIGCAMPLWMTHLGGISEGGVVAAAGVISLGISDAVAAAVGSRLGRCKWPGTQKTVEGTAAGFLAGLLGAGFWHWIVFQNSSIPWKGLCSVTAYAVLFESFTSQIDNLVLPLIQFCALILYKID